jgi:hypothetical protein
MNRSKKYLLLNHGVDTVEVIALCATIVNRGIIMFVKKYHLLLSLITINTLVVNRNATAVSQIEIYMMCNNIFNK